MNIVFTHTVTPSSFFPRTRDTHLPAMPTAWETLQRRQPIEDVEDLKEAVQSGDRSSFRKGIAVLDRNDLETSAWRRVILAPHMDSEDATAWRLMDENGEVLDEPSSGCPASGFSTESVLLDIGTEF